MIAFHWTPIVGIVLYGGSLVSCFSGIFWLMLGPDQECKEQFPDLSIEAIDNDMKIMAFQIARDHLAGRHEPGSNLHQLCEITLEPEMMQKAFFQKFGKPMSDPSMSDEKKNWEESWIRYRHATHRF